MAIAGGATVAYRCKLVNGTLQRANAPTMPTTPPVIAATVEISRSEIEAVRDRLNLWLAQSNQ